MPPASSATSSSEPQSPTTDEAHGARPRGGRPSQLLAAVVLSACIGLLGGALAAWAIYARFGPVERVVTQTIAPGPGKGSALSVAGVAQQAQPAVVVVATRPLTPLSLLGGAPGLVDGFVVSGDGLVITSVHGIRGATALSIALGDGRTFPATIVRADPVHGVALLRAVGAQGLTALSFASSTPSPGDQAIAVARTPFNPLTLSTGVVSSTGRTLTLADGEPTLSDVTSVDATADPREDGASLLSGSGAVVGVVVDAGSAAPGVIALSGRAAGQLVVQAAGGAGATSVPTLGAESVVIDSATAAAAHLPAGALVRAVTPGGPAEAAGLLPGDVVTEVNGVAIDATHPFDAVALGLTPDQQVTLTVSRAGRTQALGLTVGAAGQASG